MPFLRSQIRASSTSPLELVRAFLQSIMGAPLRSRSSFTCAAEIVGVSVLIVSFPSLLPLFYKTLTRVALRLTRDFIFCRFAPTPPDTDLLAISLQLLKQAARRASRPRRK